MTHLEEASLSIILIVQSWMIALIIWWLKLPIIPAVTVLTLIYLIDVIWHFIKAGDE
jgi:CHASE2 domain-containing sensor protein